MQGMAGELTSKTVLMKCMPVFRPVLHGALSVFFQRRYLTGRHFDPGLGGYVWGLRAAWSRNVLRLGPTIPWPTALSCHISRAENLHFHIDDLNNFQSPGTYFQNFAAHIYIGRGTLIGPNVGIITANHRLDALEMHQGGEDVVIEEGCWIGMNAVLLPGIHLGQNTVVAAGSVVTKSFPQGHALIGGVPARVLRRFD